MEAPSKDVLPRSTDQALSDSEQFTRDLFEASPDCLKLLDLDGRLLKMNGMGLCLMEIDDFTPFEGADWPTFWPGDGQSKARAAVKEAVQGRQAGFVGPCPTAKGTLKYWDVRLFPVFNSDGSVVRLISVSRDITEQKRAQDVLKAAHDELEARVAERTAELVALNASLERHNAMLREFAHVTSHDLQEPLRKITSFAGLLQTEYSDALPDEGRHFVSRLYSAARRMSDLVRDLMAFSLLAADDTDKEAVDLNEALGVVAEDLDLLVQETRGTVEVDDALPVVRGHRQQLRRLLQNLVANGLKFHRPGVPPVVRVRSHRTDTGVVVEVQDNGIGFEPQYAERIFAPFKRLHGRDAFDGTGIGLAIVRTIAERHGATVAAESTPGAGSRFLVTFPAAA